MNVETLAIEFKDALVYEICKLFSSPLTRQLDSPALGTERREILFRSVRMEAHEPLTGRYGCFLIMCKSAAAQWALRAAVFILSPYIFGPYIFSSVCCRMVSARDMRSMEPDLSTRRATRKLLCGFNHFQTLGIINGDKAP